MNRAASLTYMYSFSVGPIRTLRVLVGAVIVGAGLLSIADRSRVLHGSGPTASRILILGGCCYESEFIWDSADLYDPASNIFERKMPTMDEGREDATAVLLTGGRHAGKILIAGGTGTEEVSLSSTEFYDPGSNSFERGPNMRVGRFRHTATAVTAGPNAGKILVVGGCCRGRDPFYSAFSSTEMYDPVTNRFIRGPNLHDARYMHTATLIPAGPNAGKILIAGGCCKGRDRDLSSTEIYDPSANMFLRGPDMRLGRDGHTATVIPLGPNAGKILIAGGRTASTELYDPATNSFAIGPQMNTARDNHIATAVSAGKNRGNILIAGGCCGPPPRYGSLSSTELYDLATNSFAPIGATPTMTVGRSFFTATIITTGKKVGWILLAGGASNSTELYDPQAARFYPGPTMNAARESATAVALP